MRSCNGDTRIISLYHLPSSLSYIHKRSEKGKEQLQADVFFAFGIWVYRPTEVCHHSWSSYWFILWQFLDSVDICYIYFISLAIFHLQKLGLQNVAHYVSNKAIVITNKKKKKKKNLRIIYTGMWVCCLSSDDGCLESCVLHWTRWGRKFAKRHHDNCSFCYHMQVNSGSRDETVLKDRKYKLQHWLPWSLYTHSVSLLLPCSWKMVCESCLNSQVY